MAVNQQLAYSFTQVALMLGVSPATIRRGVERGHLRAVRIAGTRRISQAEIDRALLQGFGGRRNQARDGGAP